MIQLGANSGRDAGDSLSIQLQVTGFAPTNSAELGGYILLNTNGSCPFRLTPLDIPLVNAGAAEAQLHQKATMSNCDGSNDDVVTNDSSVHLRYAFNCGDIPADQLVSEAAKVCD